MKVLIDHQAFSIQKYGGVSKYYGEIIQCLKNSNSIKVYISVCYTENIYISDSEFYRSKLKVLSRFNHWLKDKFLKVSLIHFNKLCSIRALKQGDFDVFFPSYYDPYFLPYLNGKPFVIVIHDMIHELMPEFFEKEKKLINNKKKLIEKADKVIVFSQNNKKDIIKLYPTINSEKIVVINTSSHIEKNIDLDLKKQLPDKYILYVGGRKKYKNFDILYPTVQKLIQIIPDIQLLCIGDPFNKDELLKLEEYGIENCVHQIYIKESQLYTIYHFAQCFVFTSFYEGFGLPNVEAMASGCPLILGRYSSFPEIAEDAGIYVDMNNSDELVEAIEKVINNPSYREEKIQKGYERAKIYSLENRCNKTKLFFESNF